MADRMDEFQVIMDPNSGLDDILCQLVLEVHDSSVLNYSNFFFRDMDMRTPVCAILLNAVGVNMSELKLKFNDNSNLLSRGVLEDILRNKAPFLEELNIRGLPASVKKSDLFSANLPLPELELRRLTFKVRYEAPYSPQFLTSLFKSSQKLESLNILSKGYDVHKMGNRILSTFAEHGNMEGLTELLLGKSESDCYPNL
jgi:hypothetical protein